jgi:NADH:ubiquinone oxidoreductase subunit 3 (subunit A)
MAVSVYDYYIPVFVFLLIGLAFPAVSLVMSRMVRRSSPSAAKLTTYECGEAPFGPAWHQYNIQYYMYAILLVIFDVEVVFLFPWAVTFRELGTAPFLAMLLFLAIIVVGLLYEWKKGVLEWA